MHTQVLWSHQVCTVGNFLPSIFQFQYILGISRSSVHHRQKSRRHTDVPATQRTTSWGCLAHSNMSYHVMVYPPLIQQVTREEDMRCRRDAVSPPPRPPFRDCICTDSYLPNMSWYFGYPKPCSSLISIFCLLAFSSRFTGLLWSLGSARRETPLRHTAPGSCHPLANYKYEFNGHQAWVLKGRDTGEHPHP